MKFWANCIFKSTVLSCSGCVDAGEGGGLVTLGSGRHWVWLCTPFLPLRWHLFPYRGRDWKTLHLFSWGRSKALRQRASSRFKLSESRCFSFELRSHICSRFSCWSSISSCLVWFLIVFRIILQRLLRMQTINYLILTWLDFWLISSSVSEADFLNQRIILSDYRQLSGNCQHS